MTKVLVIAKTPEAGRVKTRLCPPCTYEDAARIAEAALKDTLDTVTSVDAEPVLVLDGEPCSWLPPAVHVLAQHGDGLGERLANAFADAGSPALLIGMDTPQVTVTMLADALRTLEMPDVDAVFGRALDGGWWAIGFNDDVPPGAFEGVPMSTAFTGAAQRRRLMKLGLRAAPLPVLRDVDTFADAVTVADDVPGSRFARCVRALQRPGAVHWDYAWQTAR